MSLAACLLVLMLAPAEPVLRGVVVDAGSGEPVAFATVVLDGERNFTSTRDGAFNFGVIAAGTHKLVVSHISYRGRTVTVKWPGDGEALRIELEPSQFTAEKIVVRAERTVSALPVGAVEFDRETITATPGNIAADPLRTLQSQPECASDGVEFLSRMAVRGGDSEEHRVYFDGYPIRHYAHVGGFAGVIYDDMIASTVLVPGAAPIRYTGTLSGLVLLNPIKPDTSFTSFRYDITSMAGGLSRNPSPSFSVQAAGKTNYFNLPVYQEVGVDSRSFRDGMARVSWAPQARLTLTATAVLAHDRERGDFRTGSARTRTLRSLLAGVSVEYAFAGWRTTLRPSFSDYDADDALTYPLGVRNHELRETRVWGALERQTRVYGVALTAETAAMRHTGSGGSHDDVPVAAAGEGRLVYGDAVALVAGAGGSREPWTESFEPEAYGSLRIDAVRFLSVSAGYRRSHQSPFLFTERRYFASFALDPGDLLSAYAPSWERAKAVRMDQVSGEATITLPLDCSVSGSVFRRRYDHLLTFDWSGFPEVADVQSDGSGRGDGYELTLHRTGAGILSGSVSMSRARVFKREGSLDVERPGDFDRPHSWQATLGVRFSRRVRVAVRWMDVDGRPITRYTDATTAPASGAVNAERLKRFRRLDAKIVYNILNESLDGSIFVDFINLLDRRNVAAMYALDTGGGYTSAPYGGTRFFPIAGATVRF